MEKTKITQVLKHYKPYFGGVEKVAEQIADVLSENGYDSEILCCSNQSDNLGEVINNTLVKRCRYSIELKLHPVSFNLIKELSKVETDVLHYHQPYISSILAHFIARPGYRSLSVTYHADVQGYDFLMFFFNPLLKFFLQKADKIHVLSESIINDSKILKDFKNKCCVIPYGISLEEIKAGNSNEINKIREITGNRKIILFVGRLVRYKGLKILLKAAGSINNEGILVLIGKGPLKKGLNKFIKRYNLNNKVLILDNVNDHDLNNFYHAAELLVLPSTTKSEAFGIVQLEAMARSKPVVNTELHTGVNFVSKGKISGLTIKPDNSEELSDSINYLLSNEQERINLGKNARERVKELFDIVKLTPKYLKYFDEL